MRKCKVFIIASFIALSMLLTPIYAYALSNESNAPVTIEPFWDNVSQISLSLSSSGSTATCEATIMGRQGTTHISATFTLARVNANGTRTTVQTWTRSTSSRSLAFSETASITQGNTYRLSVSARVTRNGFTELVTDWVERRL